MKKTKKKIKKDMSFTEILEQNPELAETLMNRGMHCAGCPMASDETLEQGALAHGIDPDEILNDINQRIDKINGKKLKSKNKNRRKTK